jgi:hypothetical protein
MRPITFDQAKARYVHRYTMEHVPVWARAAHAGRYYAPQYRSDREWYDATLFHGESPLATHKHCYSSGQTWPLGQWLAAPFQR